jgi:hypothetical protein
MVLDVNILSPLNEFWQNKKDLAMWLTAYSGKQMTFMVVSAIS